MRGGEHVDFELDLIEELAVAIGVLHNAERLFMIHLMLFDLLNLVLFIFVQNVPTELLLVLLQHFDVVHPVVEVRRHEFVEVR